MSTFLFKSVNERIDFCGLRLRVECEYSIDAEALDVSVQGVWLREGQRSDAPEHDISGLFSCVPAVLEALKLQLMTAHRGK